MSRPAATKQDTCTDSTVKVGDCYIFQSDQPDAPYYIGRVANINSRGKSTKLQVQWFYRPEEAAGGRKEFYGAHELLASDHRDRDIPVESIIRQCSVHSFDAYKQLQEVSDTDFYTRFHYKVKSQSFEPERVPVYCLCELPDNPDKPMVMCEQCEEWYHYDCLLQRCPDLASSLAQIDSMPSWTCPMCLVKQQQQQQQQQHVSAPSAVSLAVPPAHVLFSVLLDEQQQQQQQQQQEEETSDQPGIRHWQLFETHDTDSDLVGKRVDQSVLG